MRRYYKGSDIPFRLSIKDKGGVIIPLASFDSLEVIFRTSGEQYTKYYKGGGITDNEDGTYRIYANENAFGLLPDGLLKYTVKYTLNGTHDEIRECETDIFIKTPKQFQPKANVQDKSITVTENNSVSRVIPDGGYEGLGEVTVNVEIPFPLEVKEITLIENGEYEILPDTGYEGMSRVNVNVNCDAESFYVKFLRKEASGRLELPIESMDTPYCLYGQTGLTEVVVPEGATSIPNNFFMGCTSLEKITYPDTITSFGEDIYGNIDYERIMSFPLPPYLNSSLLGNIYYRDGEIFNVPKYVNQFGNYGSPSFIGSYNNGIAKRLNFKGNLYKFYYNSFIAEEVDFRYNVQVPTFYRSSIYTGMTKIIVPESLYDTWITTSPWSDYAAITESVPDTDYFIPYQTKSGNDIALTTGVKEDRYAVISSSDKKILLRGTPWQMKNIIVGKDITYIDFAASNLEVPDFTELFRGATQLTGCTLPVNKPLICRNMFENCTSLVTVPKMDTSCVIDMYEMFYECSSLTAIPEMDTSNVTTMFNMFSGCYSLATVPEMNTSRVTDMGGMFSRCSSLATVPGMDTSKVTDMGYMFNGCSSLTVIPEMNTSRVTGMGAMFSECSSLATVPGMDTSKVRDMHDMFYKCNLLTSVPEMDTSNVYNMDTMFQGCTSLTDLGGFVGLKCNLDLSASSIITHDSLMNVINKAADVTASPATLTLGSTNLTKLSDEEKAIATAKGWTLA